MRALVSRGLLLSPLVCAALVFGPLGTAAAAVDVSRTAPGGAAAAWSSAEADAVMERLDVLDRVNHHDALLDPLLDVLSTLTARGAGTLDAVEAAGLATAVETANASLQQRLKERTGVTSSTSSTSSTPNTADRSVSAAADPVSDLVAQLQSAIDSLVKALTSLDLGAVLGAVTGLLGPVLGLVTGLLGGATSALPALPAAGSPATVS